MGSPPSGSRPGRRGTSPCGAAGRTIEALVARENYGQALATIPLRDFLHLLAEHGDSAHIECKHLARIALHSIYEGKFSRKTQCPRLCRGPLEGRGGQREDPGVHPVYARKLGGPTRASGPRRST